MTYIRGYICKNKETNIKCQNYLFSQGYGWGLSHIKKFSHIIEDDILVVDANKSIYHCSYDGLDRAKEMWPLDFSPNFVLKEFNGTALMETE